MPGTTQTDTGQGTTTEAEATETGTGTQTTEQASTATSGGGKNITLPNKAFKDRLDHAKAAGKKEALAELESMAQAAGFTSHAEMVGFVKELKSKAKGGNGTGQAATQTSAADTGGQASTQRPTPPANKHDRRAMERYNRDLERWNKERSELTRKVAQSDKRARLAVRDREALEARMALERVAMQKGIKDVDFAIHLITKDLEGKSEEELKTFDEGKFFEGLRTTRPYLFGETVVPATTGTGGEGAPQTPKPGETTAQTATNGQLDARKMKPEEYAALLKKHGINPHALL